LSAMTPLSADLPALSQTTGGPAQAACACRHGCNGYGAAHAVDGLKSSYNSGLNFPPITVVLHVTDILFF